MKKLFLFLLLIGFTQAFAYSAPVTISVQTDTTATSDDIQFTEIGSSADSAANAALPDSTVLKANSPVSSDGASGRSQSLWVTFGLGLLAGIAAFIMPCIFPMVPLTVSFFTKRAETKGKGIQGAILYGISIIVIYVALGVIITLIWGAGALNDLSTDGYFNVFIFIVLLVFGISFLGAFEITLPSRFVNKLDEKSDSKGFVGIFFMAATLSVVSFSCTGPLIGGLLTIIDKDVLTPIVAMFGFSLSLALIFTVFAIFPMLMTSLPKSGGWLNSVKVVLGFLEIGLAMKFLSTADLVYHWGILDREVFLSIWIVLAFILGLYLLGKIKFSHDSDIPYVSIPRLIFACASFVFAIYMIPGLWGAPLKAISALVPPLATQDYVVQQGVGSPITANTSGEKRKYSDFLHIPLNIDGFFDYEEALAYAKKVNKPLFLDFTGHGCVNCRKMEADVWTDPRVLKHLKEDFIVVSLYVDDKTALPENEQFESKLLKKRIDNVGKKFQLLQYEKFNTQSQPYYVLLDTDEKELVSPPIGAEFNVEAYLKYLEDGLATFAKEKRMKEIKNIAVLTSGGDSPGMNAAIRAVVRAGQYYNRQVFGVMRGYDGLIHEDLHLMERKSVANIIQRGGTILKTARCDDFRSEAGRQKAFETLKRNEIDALVVIGGDGTFTGAKRFTEEYHFPIIGLPGTIDNDLAGTDFTIGYDTAINTVVGAVDRIRDTAESHDRLFIVEVMGRDSGLIALRSGIGVGAEAIMVPESNTGMPELIEKLKTGRKDKASKIIIIAEGDIAGGAYNVGEALKQEFPQYDIRISVLGHIQRGGKPSCMDRVLASRFGVAAVEGLMDGKSGVMVGQVNKEIVFTPFTQAIKHIDVNEVSPAWLKLVEILSY